MANKIDVNGDRGAWYVSKRERDRERERRNGDSSDLAVQYNVATQIIKHNGINATKQRADDTSALLLYYTFARHFAIIKYNFECALHLVCKRVSE